MGWPIGIADYGGLLANYRLHLLSHIQGHTIRDLAYYLIFYFAPLVFHFPFPLKHVSFLQHCISWHQLNCASSSIIVALLSVHFTVQLVLGFSIGFFEVLAPPLHRRGLDGILC